MKKIVMVTLSTCPWCKKTIKYFERHQVPFENIYYDQQTAEEQARLERLITGMGDNLTFPWVRIGADTVSGWNPEKYARLLGLDPGEMTVKFESRKEALRFYFGRVVEALGYKFSPDAELVEFCLDQEVELEKKAGAPYCPCQGRVNRREEDMKIVCPCIPFHRGHYDYMKRCWCGLFVRQDVTDPDSLPQIALKDIPNI